MRLQQNGFQNRNARRPLALTLPLKSMGIRHAPWQLETKLPQSQTDAKGVDGRAIGDGFAAVHESGCGPKAKSMDVRLYVSNREKSGNISSGTNPEEAGS